MYSGAENVLCKNTKDTPKLPIKTNADLVGFKTPHSMLLGSNRHWFSRGIFWAMQDAGSNDVHWQVGLSCVFCPWKPFDEANHCTTYLLTIFMTQSFLLVITWIKVTVADCIRQSWILESHVHSKVPILCSLPNYHSFCRYSCILTLFLILWNQKIALSSSFWNSGIRTSIQSKASKLRVFPSCNFILPVYRSLYIQIHILTEIPTSFLPIQVTAQHSHKITTKKSCK